MTNIIKENLSGRRTNFSKILPPSMKDTHELLAEAFERSASLKDKLVRPFGVDKDTITAWARPKSSDINPFGTGKGNPLDRTEKLIEMTHVSDPEMGREIAEHFSKFVDELDRQRGLTEAFEMGNPCAAISKVVEAQAKLVNSTIKGCENPENAVELFANTKILKTRVLQLEGCLRALIQAEGEQ
jgi:hypothetical protein